jgi:DNA-binding transcriptional LysR family regulator
MAVLGERVPPQLATVLALQRAEEPDTHVALAGWTDPGRAPELPGDSFDFALSATDWQWPGWICEPLWHDTLAVAVAKRSHLLAYREVPCEEVLKQSLICAQSTADEPWRMTVQRVFENALQGKRGPKTLLTRSPDQTSRTWRSSAKPTRHLVPSPVLMVAVRSLMRTMVPTCVCR